MEIKELAIFDNGNVMVFDMEGKQIPELQGDMFEAAVKCSKYLLPSIHRESSHQALFVSMFARAKEMRGIGFQFNWAECEQETSSEESSSE
jgi:hypothetical protein